MTSGLTCPRRVADTGTNLLECSHCGLVQSAGASRPGHVLVCGRCESRLPSGPPGSHRLAAVCASAAALLLIIAFGEPVFEMHLLGRYATANLLSGPRMLAERELPELAVVVFLTLFIAPLAHFAILGAALLASQLQKPPRFLFMPLGFAETTRHWSMSDVFLLATLVCYMRLRAWANVELGSALFSLLALTIVTVTAESALDPRELWKRMPWHRPSEPAGRRVPTRHIACAWCGLVRAAHQGERCARCGRTLRARKRNSLTRTASLMLAAAFLSVPANVLPVMDMIQFGRNDTNTIYSGVVELAQHSLWGLAVLIFVASIVIPMLKLVVLGLLIWTTARRSTTHLRLRTRAFQFVRNIGRWSLVDVFAVTILVSLVHMGILATVLPRYGAVAFCAVVVLTMLAAEAFDPRLMWDAAGLNGPPHQERAS
ncbi:MAG: Paraquat-inducible protein [Myxococcaceae bacterium]|nr:Paraquat-inducible protein [Myxococcaceae bacterium]